MDVATSLPIGFQVLIQAIETMEGGHVDPEDLPPNGGAGQEASVREKTLRIAGRTLKAMRRHRKNISRAEELTRDWPLQKVLRYLSASTPTYADWMEKFMGMSKEELSILYGAYRGVGSQKNPSALVKWLENKIETSGCEDKEALKKRLCLSSGNYKAIIEAAAAEYRAVIPSDRALAISKARELTKDWSLDHVLEYLSCHYVAAYEHLERIHDMGPPERRVLHLAYRGKEARADSAALVEWVGAKIDASGREDKEALKERLCLNSGSHEVILQKAAEEYGRLFSREDLRAHQAREKRNQVVALAQEITKGWSLEFALRYFSQTDKTYDNLERWFAIPKGDLEILKVAYRGKEAQEDPTALARCLEVIVDASDRGDKEELKARLCSGSYEDIINVVREEHKALDLREKSYLETVAKAQKLTESWSLNVTLKYLSFGQAHAYSVLSSVYGMPVRDLATVRAAYRSKRVQDNPGALIEWVTAKIDASDRKDKKALKKRLQLTSKSYQRIIRAASREYTKLEPPLPKPIYAAVSRAEEVTKDWPLSTALKYLSSSLSYERLEEIFEIGREDLVILNKAYRGVESARDPAILSRWLEAKVDASDSADKEALKVSLCLASGCHTTIMSAAMEAYKATLPVDPVAEVITKDWPLHTVLKYLSTPYPQRYDILTTYFDLPREHLVILRAAYHSVEAQRNPELLVKWVEAKIEASSSEDKKALKERLQLSSGRYKTIIRRASEVYKEMCEREGAPPEKRAKS